MSELREQLIEIIRARGLQYHEERVQLAAGRMSHYFVDGKRALRAGHDLVTAGKAVLELVEELGVEFDAVGGLTNGADHVAHIVAVLADAEWFFVRKQAKDRGTRQRIEGALLGPGVRVLLVDDVVTSGGSMTEALAEIEKAGAQVVGAVALVDRDDRAAKGFADRRIPYAPVVRYRDLGIPSVSDEPEAPVSPPVDRPACCPPLRRTERAPGDPGRCAPPGPPPPTPPDPAHEGPGRDRRPS